VVIILQTMRRLLHTDNLSKIRRVLLPLMNGLWTKQYLFVFSLFYMLSAADGISPNAEDSERRFLRTTGVVEAEVDDDIMLPTSTVQPKHDDNADEFDYETFHKKHIGALSSTMMMGLAFSDEKADSKITHRRMLTNVDPLEDDALSRGRRILSFAGTNAAASAGAQPSEHKVNVEAAGDSGTDGTDDYMQRKTFSFAGTNAAMKHFASDKESMEKATSATPIEERRQLAGTEIDSGFVYQSTLSQIAKSRSLLLWGDEEETDEAMTNGDHAEDHENAEERPDLTRTENDLDRGRYLVGLQVRHVRPHQRLLIDYKDESDTEQVLKPLRIKYLYADNAPDSSLTLLSTLMDTSFNRTATFFSNALFLSPVIGSINPTVSVCGDARIPNREDGVVDADILIYVTGDNTYCGGALIHSAVCDFDQNHRPVVANINICTNNVPNTTLGNGSIQLKRANLAGYDEHIATETARVLGASSSLFRYYQNPDTQKPYGASKKTVTCVDGTSETLAVPNVISERVDSSTSEVYYEIRTPIVIEVARNHFVCMTLTGVRLEAKKDSTSCFGAFVDDRVFFGEQLTSFQWGASQWDGPVISPLTLALLEDSSWYTANYTHSTETSFGRSSGCSFARGSCRVDDGYEDHHKGFHCSKIGRGGCDLTHSFKAQCDRLHPSTGIFESSQEIDMCPMYVRGVINCADATDISAVTARPGEYYGESSKCIFTDGGIPLCLKGTCNEMDQSLEVQYQDEVFECKRDGQIIDTMLGVQIDCPRLASVCPSLVCPSNCSGRGVCDEDGDSRYSCICDDPIDETDNCSRQ